MKINQNVSGFPKSGSICGTAKQSGWSVKKTSTSKKNAKSKLDYNFREVSSLLLNARHSQVAKGVLMIAYDRLTYLRSAAATGRYDKKEVSNALAHANKMVICAKTKIQNLEEEETEKQENDKSRKSLSKTRSSHRKLQRKRELKLKLKELELKKKCRRHRSEEKAGINEANETYESRKNMETQEYPVFDSSENAVILELRKLEIEEYGAKDGSMTGNTVSMESQAAVADGTFSADADITASMDCSNIDISV